MLLTMAFAVMAVVVMARPAAAASAPALSPPSVPSDGMYLGAWINDPNLPGSGNGAATLIAQYPQFRNEIFTNSPTAQLGTLVFYTGFASGSGDATYQASIADPSSPFYVMTQLEAEDPGVTPIVSWGCQAGAATAIASGQDDALINRWANYAAAFGRPIFLRWGWEMNGGANASCGNGPQFVAAWDRIHQLFVADGATNVAFVWCPGLSGQNNSGFWTTLATYYPGDSEVDWIGVDFYDRTEPGSTAFTALFHQWYQTYSTHGKPMMIGETGALSDPATNDSNQATYIASWESVLNPYGNGTGSEFPLLKSINYFDAVGPSGPWEMQGPGLTAFASLANDPNFQFRASTISTTTNVSGPVTVGVDASQPFAACVSASGGSVPTGSIMVYDGSSPIGSAMPVSSGGCITADLSFATTGDHLLTAAFSGVNGAFAQSISAVLSVNVVAAPIPSSVRFTSMPATDGQYPGGTVYCPGVSVATAYGKLSDCVEVAPSMYGSVARYGYADVTSDEFIPAQSWQFLGSGGGAQIAGMCSIAGQQLAYEGALDSNAWGGLYWGDVTTYFGSVEIMRRAVITTAGACSFAPNSQWEVVAS